MEVDSINAETAFLSLLINNPELLVDYSGITSEIYSSSINKKIFEVLLSLSNSELIPEFSLLISTLKSKNLLEICGGEKYLLYLRNLQYDKQNIKEFYKILINNYKTRRFISLINTINTSSIQEYKINEIISEVESNLESINSLVNYDSVNSIGEITPKTLAELQSKVGLDDKVLVSSGFKHIDSITGGFSGGDLWYVAGRPGMGKTAWCLNSINNLIEKDVPVLLFSLEMRPVALTYRLLSIRTGIPIMKIKLGILNNKEFEQIKTEIEKIKSFPFYIDNNFDVDISYIQNITKKYVQNYGIKVVHIDYFQLIDSKGSDNLTREYGRISRILKILANSLNITVVAYSQLNRNVESRKDTRPLLADLRDSGNLEQDADIVLMLYRDIKYNPNTKDKGILENIFRKHREGPEGVLFSYFVPETTKITEKF